MSAPERDRRASESSADPIDGFRDLSPWASLWPLDPQVHFLNHGSFGSCPIWVLEQYRSIQERMEREPLRMIVEDLEELLDRARRSLAEFAGADESGLVFVTNATEGVNAVVGSLDLRPGDELLTSTHEYNACNNALGRAAERAGASVRTIDLPFPLSDSAEVAERIIAAITDRTRLVLISHVTSPTALVMPIEAIVSECNRRGIDTLIDGAHAPGMVPVDLRTLNPTFYTGNCHKWLCSPKGAGFLWVREDRRSSIRPAVISHGANSPRTDRPRLWLEFDYCGTRDFAAWLTVPLCVAYLGSLHSRGWSGLMERNRLLALRGRDVLCSAMGIPSPAPDSMIGSMVSVPLPDRPSGVSVRKSRYHDALQEDVYGNCRAQAPVFVMPGSGKRIARLSCQLYNSLSQVELYAKSLADCIGRERV